MKKKSLLAIMLIALVLTLGVMVSCQPDPDPDELKGTWVYEPIPGFSIKLVSDGYGSFTLTITEGGESETASGKYTLENGFVVFSDSGTHTSSEPAGVFVHPTATPSQYHIGLSDESTLYYSDDPTSANYDNYIQTPFTEEGTTYSDTHSTVTISGSTITFNWDEVYKVSDVAVYEEIIKGTATCALTGDVYPAAYMVYYNENYDTNQIKTRYHVSGNTLTIYEKRTPMDFTKQ